MKTRVVNSPNVKFELHLAESLGRIPNKTACSIQSRRFSKKNLLDFALLGDGVAEGIQTGRRRRGGGSAVLLLDLQVDFLAVDGDIARGGDTEANLVAPDFNDGDFDIVADFDTLV